MRYTLFLLLLLSLSPPLFSEPWGKDADLATTKSQLAPQPTLKPSSSILTRFGITAIRFHQDVISPADGPRSHFIPSSSQYTLEAMTEYGFFIGYLMGCDRLMRENNEEWVYRKILDCNGKLMKWDPVR